MSIFGGYGHVAGSMAPLCGLMPPPLYGGTAHFKKVAPTIFQKIFNCELKDIKVLEYIQMFASKK